MTAGAFAALWSAIEPIGRDPSTGGYRRFAWSGEDAELREWFAGEAVRRGLDLVEDRMGNQWAWWGDPDRDGPGVVTGSHLDSVPDGGAYDGPLGVVSAFAALDALRETRFVPRRPVGIVNFADEEGARFGVACAGSRVITGALAAERACGLIDADGITMAEAIRRTGRDPDRLGPDPQTLARVATFVELHVEQGRQLVHRGAAVGLGRDIWPHGRWRVEVAGEANHAGTTALADRSDALVECARTVLGARDAAERHGCLATVGKVVVRPGGVNAVPGGVTCWLDARGPEEERVRAVVSEVARPGVSVSEESWTPRTAFDARLVGRLGELLPGTPVLGTGAGHDAGILANAGIAAAMIFVRNPTGISHSPAEHAGLDDCLAGVSALARVLTGLAGPPS